MTILKVEYVPCDGIFKNHKKPKLHLKCDHCGKIFICCDTSVSRKIKQDMHFCGRKCANESNISGKLKDKREKTLLNRYGHISVFGTEKFKNDQIELCMQKYGVKSRLESPEILEKIKQTCIEKYGRETFAGSKEWEDSIDRKEIAKKAWITKIENGTCAKSSFEDRLNQILINKYGENNIERQVEMIGQWIDFYIWPYNTYIQVDGVYWHGLNRPLKIIKLGKTRQDKDIYDQVLRDRKLNKHMKKNNLKLLRITDEQMDEMTDGDIIKYIEERA